MSALELSERRRIEDLAYAVSPDWQVTGASSLGSVLDTVSIPREHGPALLATILATTDLDSYEEWARLVREQGHWTEGESGPVRLAFGRTSDERNFSWALVAAAGEHSYLVEVSCPNDGGEDRLCERALGLLSSVTVLDEPALEALDVESL